MKFKTFKYIDQQFFGCEAFSMLIPEGWITTGGLIWRQHPTMPAAMKFSVKSPDGFNELCMLPAQPYSWAGNTMGFFGPKEGSYYLGNEVRRPVSNHLQYIKQYLLSRRGFETKIVSDSRSPELENAIRMENQGGYGFNVTVDAGIVKLEYGYKNFVFEENMSCGILSVGSMYGGCIWVADKIVSTRSLKGKLTEMDKIFSVMLQSFRFNLKWFDYYNQYVKVLTQNTMNSINNAMVISNIIRNTYNEISEITKQSYEYQQATYDKVFRGISEGIRGVNSYYDPYKGYAVQIPNNYRYVYANPLGEYFMTDNPNENPNIGSNLNWTNLNQV